MLFNYNTKMTYFKEKELAHLQEFMDKVKEGLTYVTPSGKAYSVLRLFQPKGLITPTTNFSREALPDNSMNYACPNSSIDGVEFKIIYKENNNEMLEAKSKEFLNLIGDDYEVYITPDNQPDWIKNIGDRLEMNKRQAVAKTETPEEYKEKGETWQAGKRTASPKKKKTE